MHYVIRVLKSCLWDSRCQTYVFKTEPERNQMYQSWQLAKVLQSNLYTVPEVEVHNGKVSCFCGKHFLVFIDISFFSGNISPFFCKKTIIYVIIQD